MSGFSVSGSADALDWTFGDNAAAAAPSSYTLRLYDASGVELDAGTDYPGYTPATLTNNSTNFPDADVDGVKTCPAVSLGAATGDWVDQPKSWGLCDGTGTTIRYSARISDGGLTVDGEDVTLVMTMFPGV